MTMKVYICKKDSYQESVNFIENENTFVGFSNDQQCCEDFGWRVNAEGDPDELIFKAEPNRNVDKEPGLQCSYPGYRFDKDFRQEIERENGEGGEMKFRLIKDGAPNLILTLYNYHNGYYSHGFTFTVDGKVIADSSI